MKSKRQMGSNYDYFVKLDTSPYRGEWMAIAGRKIVAHGKDAEIVFRKAAKKYKATEISLAKAPNEQMLVLKFDAR